MWMPDLRYSLESSNKFSCGSAIFFIPRLIKQTRINNLVCVFLLPQHSYIFPTLRKNVGFIVLISTALYKDLVLKLDAFQDRSDDAIIKLLPSLSARS